MQIVWFKRDLRSEDHRALASAARTGPVLPLFIAESELWQQPDMSARQWAFVSESLADLRQDLAELGQALIIRVGDTVPILERARAHFGSVALWSHEETGNTWTFERDKRVADWAKANGVDWHEIQQNGVIRRIRSRDGWARRWDQLMAEPLTAQPRGLEPITGIDAGPIPSAADLGLKPDPCPGRQLGGRTNGLKTLDSFLYERGAPYRRAMSAPVDGAHHCSRLSPHLAWGTVSMREVSQATRVRQRQLKEEGIKGGWRGSLSSFQGRLHWRDHFTQKLEDQPSMEVHNLHAAYDGLRPTQPDPARLSAWCAGETGLPFVDACMRALRATGWMNFRMRAMLMAVSSYHLWLDWRKPGEHLARCFTDYDAGIHWPQVQMQSGTTGINTVRIYNPVKQGHDQDPEGTFIRDWIPELATVPDQYIHEPWMWDQASTLLGRAYPFPIIDHLAAAKDARQKVWAIRRGAGFRDTANKIQVRHGSRKSGIPMRGKQTPKKAERLQLTLPLDGTTEDTQ
ncbi:MAG: deoxyribodipyrimidine photo-lyase [Pseudomonadota bacterium]